MAHFTIFDVGFTVIVLRAAILTEAGVINQSAVLKFNEDCRFARKSQNYNKVLTKKLPGNKTGGMTYGLSGRIVC